uniref:Putative middle protein n=2 Tax=unclassified Parvoviridae TaxID=535600 RepID=V5K7G7_9VIRU|nr:putative middle protein [Myotis ricketti parvovirus]
MPPTNRHRQGKLIFSFTMLKKALCFTNCLLQFLLIILPGIMGHFGYSGLIPVLIGFILMLLLFLFLLYMFLNALLDFHPPSNYLGYRNQNQFRRTLCGAFFPVLLSFSITLLIWALFIWMFYFQYDHLHHLNCTLTNSTKLTCTISHF